MSGFDRQRIGRLARVMGRHVEEGVLGGVAWIAMRDDDVEVGTAGVLTRGEQAPIERDTIFRIASMTKPVAAVAALMLVEECRLRLDDPVDDLLPELANRRVLVDPLGPVDGETVPAIRPITVHDVLTFRLGYGMAFDWPWPQPFLDATMEMGIATAPPQPLLAPDPDMWIQKLGELPLLHQPGARWLYHYGADVLGVLIARAADEPLEQFLAERVLEPLGMRDTAFYASDPSRLTSCYARDPDSGEHVCFDPPEGEWAMMPPFPSAGGGLVSTIDDFAAFGRMLLAGGCLADGSRLLSRASVEAMTTDQIGAGPDVPGPTSDGAQGWGFGVGVQVRRVGLGPTVGGYGWAGGLGSSWGNDPAERLVGVVLTTDMFTSAYPPPAAIQDFWTNLYASLDR